uniref:SHSP domain-containing protein n=1 Tax=Parascaris univalens TaxID=6257 RepID=A0A915AYN9_PARUN
MQYHITNDRQSSLKASSRSPFDLNMPSTIRKRERIDDFLLDPPLTNIGAHFSRQLGLSMIHEVPTVIYTSPQLANIQTGRKLLEGIPVGVGWNIEPGLAGYYPAGADCPKFDVKLKKDTVLKVPYINSVLGKETLEEFHRRIAHVVSKLDFPLGESTIIVAEACVIDAIVQTFIRNGEGLTQKQRASLETRIPCLSMMHFDVKDNGKWRMSAASLPGLLSECAQMMSIPDVNFIVRPIFDY